MIEERITAIKAAMPLTLDPAVIEPHRLQIEILIEQSITLLKTEVSIGNTASCSCWVFSRFLNNPPS